MRVFRDFSCECGEVTEKYISNEVNTIECSCGKTAQKVLSMPRVKLEGITGAFPGAADRWARIREDNARIKAKREQ
jgi:hypothetical protein